MSDHQSHYDYIIAGAGAAGLSLLARMIRSGGFSHKKILLVDKDRKNRNDRTWCFWEQEESFFEEIVYKKWNRLWYHGADFTKRFDIAPYWYKMIRGIDFYRHCLGIISAAQNVTVAYGELTAMHSCENDTWLMMNDQKITADYIFSSIPSKPTLLKGEYYLQQHFKGWLIETEKPLFNPEEATLMDFRVSQHHGATFVYVMPFSPNRALVEYTLFSKNLLTPQQYEDGLKDYIANYLGCDQYTIQEEEFGVIPMTNHRFTVNQSNIINIGTAGGQTKGSSGYTFRSIQKNSDELVKALMHGGEKLTLHQASRKFHFYDSVLLNVLATGKAEGAFVFTEMFKKNSTGRIFRFLDNESSLPEDVKIISTLPIWPFLKAGIQQLV